MLWKQQQQQKQQCEKERNGNKAEESNPKLIVYGVILCYWYYTEFVIVVLYAESWVVGKIAVKMDNIMKESTEKKCVAIVCGQNKSAASLSLPLYEYN